MFDCNGITERVKKFDISHGENAVVIDGWLLFPDGGRREIDPIGCLCEPPTKVFEQCRLIAKYHEVKLALAVEEFTVFKNNLLALAKATLNGRCAPPEKETLAHLRELKEKVVACKNRFEKAKTDLEKNVPANIREREKIAEANRQQSEAFVDALREIEV